MRKRHDPLWIVSLFLLFSIGMMLLSVGMVCLVYTKKRRNVVFVSGMMSSQDGGKQSIGDFFDLIFYSWFSVGFHPFL